MKSRCWSGKLNQSVIQIIHTTNVIESLRGQARKAVYRSGHFPGDKAATKLINPTLKNVMAKWKILSIPWHHAKD